MRIKKGKRKTLELSALLKGLNEAGGNFIDTANIYNNGTSETYLGEFIRADRE